MRRTATTLTAVAMLTILAATALALETAEPDTAELEGLTPEQLFLRASSSALQFEHMREPSRKVLVRKHEESIPFLVTQLDTDGVRERHALEDVLVRIGEPAVPAVVEAFLMESERTDVTRGARLAATVLGIMGYDAHNVKYGMMGWTADDAVLATGRFNADTQPDYRLEGAAPTVMPTSGGVPWQTFVPYGLMALGTLSAGLGALLKRRKAA